MPNITYRDAIELAYGKGELKKWVKEKVLLTALEKTYEGSTAFLKLKDFDPKNEVIFEENEEEWMMKWTTGYIAPQNSIIIHIRKKNNLIYLTRDEFEFYEEKIEEKICKWLNLQIKNKNLIWESNFDGQEVLIK